MSEKNQAARQGSPIDTKYNGSEFTQIGARTATTKPASQIERVLLALLYNGSINCQEAEHQPIKARHLNSVISELANRHQLEVGRQREQVKGYQGTACHLTRYSLPTAQTDRAQAMVNQLRARRNAPPINWRQLTSHTLNQYLQSAESCRQSIRG